MIALIVFAILFGLISFCLFAAMESGDDEPLCVLALLVVFGFVLTWNVPCNETTMPLPSYSVESHEGYIRILAPNGDFKDIKDAKVAMSFNPSKVKVSHTQWFNIYGARYYELNLTEAAPTLTVTQRDETVKLK